MFLIHPEVKILHVTLSALDLIEYAGRTCYQSRGKIKDGKQMNFIRNLIVRGHESPLEHASMTVNVLCNRITQQQWTRHRIAAYSIESRRYNVYCNGVTYIIPYWCKHIEPGEYKQLNNGVLWPTNYSIEAENNLFHALHKNESDYLNLLDDGKTGEEASEILSICLKSEMVVTHNFREWRHIFKERTRKCCSPAMYTMMRKLLLTVKERIPVVFDDIEWEN